MSEQIGEFTLKHSGCTFGTNSEGEMIDCIHNCINSIDLRPWEIFSKYCEK